MHQMSDSTFVLLFCFAVGYLLPSIVALCRGAQGRFMIVAINVLFGWDVLHLGSPAVYGGCSRTRREVLPQIVPREMNMRTEPRL